LWQHVKRQICVCAAAWKRNTAEVGGAGRDSIEHHRDLQLTAAGSWNQDKEAEKSE